MHINLKMHVNHFRMDYFLLLLVDMFYLQKNVNHEKLLFKNETF